jgi:uncharacterized protein YbjQ (UPF0145 family)
MASSTSMGAAFLGWPPLIASPALQQQDRRDLGGAACTHYLVPGGSQEGDMLTTTTDVLEGFEVTDYLGLVTGESILGANILRDVLGTVTDYVGGRSAAYEEVLEKARHEAVLEMTDRAQVLGADAVIGAALDYETIGSRGSMLMVTVAGTAVRLRKK